MNWNRESDDSDWDDEDWDPDYGDDDEETSTVTCPNCGTEVYEESDQCPECGEFIMPPSTHPLAGRGLLFVGLGLLGIVVTIVVLILAGF